jgi:Zn-finger nucleic acid-binding protein
VKCPRDYSVLSLQESEHVVGQVCNECKGIFLEGKGVAAFRYNHETSILEETVQIPSKIKTSIKCPCCNSSMMLASLDDVQLDKCQNCQGIWFDESEVSKIVKTYSRFFSTPSGEERVAHGILEVIMNLFLFLKW